MRPVSGLLDLLQQVVCMCNKSKHVCDNNANPEFLPKPKTTTTVQPVTNVKRYTPANHKPVSFTVVLDEGGSKKGKMPARFMHKAEGRPITPYCVLKKQEEAEARRREYQDNRLQKIRDLTGYQRAMRQPTPQAV